jgi:hypothetical protein
MFFYLMSADPCILFLCILIWILFAWTERTGIVKVIKSLKPFKITLPMRNAISILEIPSYIVYIEMLR